AGQGAGPGAEVCRGEVRADDRLDVVVDVAVLHAKELASAKLFQRGDDLRHVLVVDGALVFLPPLADVVEAQRGAVDGDVPALNRGQAVRRLRFRALVVADAEESLVDETDDGGEDLFAPFALQVRAHAPPQRRQRLAELHHAAELLFLARGAEARVVEVLRPSFLVHAEGLQRRGVAARDAHVAPRRRDAQPRDARQGPVVFDRGAEGGAVAEARLLRSLTPDAVQVEVPTTPDPSGHDE